MTGRMSFSDAVGIFPGQGSEHEGMMEPFKGLTLAEEVFGRIGKALGRRFSPVCLGAGLDAQLTLFGASVCCWHRLAGRYGFSALAGHSLGFYSALYAAGSLGLEDCVCMMAEAQKAIEEFSGGERFSMAVIIGLPEERCGRICAEVGGVYVSAVNSATQIVLSGREDPVREAMAKALAAGALDARPFGAGYALHSPFMKGIGERLSPFVRGLGVAEPSIPVFDHTGGGFLTTEGIKEVLSRQLERKVLWRQTVLSISALGARRFLEIGPSGVLSKLVRWMVREAEAITSEEAMSA